MKRIFSCLFFIFMCVSVPMWAFAQSVDKKAESGTTSMVVNTPEGWSEGSPDQISSTRIRIFVQPEAENRIEIFKRDLVNTAHAETLFSAFQEQLMANRFSLTSEEKDKVYDLNNGEKLTALNRKYEYLHDDIKIVVETVSFVDKQQAYIFVGYFSPIAGIEGHRDFENMIRSLDIRAE